MAAVVTTEFYRVVTESTIEQKPSYGLGFQSNQVFLRASLTTLPTPPRGNHFKNKVFFEICFVTRRNAEDLILVN